VSQRMPLNGMAPRYAKGSEPSYSEPVSRVIFG
jgi:hypothetical protein